MQSLSKKNKNKNQTKNKNKPLRKNNNTRKNNNYVFPSKYNKSINNRVNKSINIINNSVNKSVDITKTRVIPQLRRGLEQVGSTVYFNVKNAEPQFKSGVERVESALRNVSRNKRSKQTK